MEHSETVRWKTGARALLATAAVMMTLGGCKHQLEAERLRGDVRVAEASKQELFSRLQNALERERNAVDALEKKKKEAAALEVELASASATSVRLAQENKDLREDKAKLHKLVEGLFDQLATLTKSWPKRYRDLMSDLIRATRAGIKFGIDNKDKVNKDLQGK